MTKRKPWEGAATGGVMGRSMTVFIAAPATVTLPVRLFLLDRFFGLERLLAGRSADGRK